MTRISVIIPTWCEVSRIGNAVRRCAAIADETIVVVANGPDDTLRIAERAGALTLISAKGRGRQLNAGARHASGDTLLFVHADAELPSNARSAIRSALAENGSLRS